ncbi:MAG: RecX family transcriptional regulator [Blastocatellia bacterium]|nr:RecX family transcriptional regulator [Blastocatellia bacterium]
MDEKSFQAALASAVAILAVRPRSIADFSARLDRKLRKQHPELEERKSLLAAVVERLREYGYLDDERFAEQFAQSQVSRRAVGKRRLAQDLGRQKVEKTVIAQTLNQVYSTESEADIMERHVTKFVQTFGIPTTPQAAKRLLGTLIRRGFPYDLATERLRRLARSAKMEVLEDALSSIDPEE